MPPVIFTNPAVEQDEHRGTARETRYEPGEVYDLPADKAEIWKSRNCAVDAPPGAKPKVVSPKDKEATMKVRFTHPVRDGETVYTAGQTYDLPTPIALRWIERSCAVDPNAKATKADAAQPNAPERSKPVPPPRARSEVRASA